MLCLASTIQEPVEISVFLCIALLLFSASIGSFLGMASYRLPRNIPIGLSRSRCTQCQTTLAAQHLFPLISYIALGGKCATCRIPIAARYFWIEISTILLTLSFYCLYGLTLYAMTAILLAWILLYISIVDIEHYSISISSLLLLGVVSLLLLYVNHQPLLPAILRSSLLTLGILGIRYAVSYCVKRESLGLGDVILFAFIGLILPWQYYPTLLLIAGSAGIIWDRLHRRTTKAFPFGPCLCLSLLLCLLFPNVTALQQYC